MANFNERNVLDVLSAPLGDLISSVGRGVADAQREMDLASLAALREVYQSSEELYRDLQRIGYRPTWYHIPEAEGDLQVALTVAGQSESSSSNALAARTSLKVYAAPIHAGYSSRFDFKLEATSRIKFRIVPVPPSGAAEAIQVVPALTGLTLGEAESRLALLGIAYEGPQNAESTDTVSAQTPAAGTLLRPGESVSLEIA